MNKSHNISNTNKKGKFFCILLLAFIADLAFFHTLFFVEDLLIFSKVMIFLSSCFFNIVVGLTLAKTILKIK